MKLGGDEGIEGDRACYRRSAPSDCDCVDRLRRFREPVEIGRDYDARGDGDGGDGDDDILDRIAGKQGGCKEEKRVDPREFCRCCCW